MFGRRKHRPTAAKLERGVRHRRRTSSEFVRESALVAVIISCRTLLWAAKEV